MYKFLILATIAVVGSNARTRSLKLCQEIKEALRNSNINGELQWKPDCNNRRVNQEISLGLLPETHQSRSQRLIPLRGRVIPKRPGQSEKPTAPTKLPEFYDAREVWGNECPSFKHIGHQGNCANCWTVAATSMINDRVCMFNKPPGQNQTFYSAKQMTNCISKCKPGELGVALDFWIKKGLVTGGDFRMQQSSGCQAYPEETADMYNGTCSDNCDDGTPFPAKEKSRGYMRYELRFANIEDIMMEIYLFGPVVGRFYVYEDFAYYYQGGVYKKTAGEYMGEHALKMFGWGVENGVKYWLVANSWGDWFGDNGFAKIQRGTNESGIESTVYVAIPQGALE